MDPARETSEVTDEDRARFVRVVSEELTPEQLDVLRRPDRVHARQKSVLAVHWHPEFIPLDVAMDRVHDMFPNRESELVIPTQHNELMTLGPYAGVEVDCYSRGFNQKVQLLLHFRADRLEGAHVLRSMLAHTHKYRSSQLFDFMETIVGPNEDRIRAAARETGADRVLVDFVRTGVTKVRDLLEASLDKVPANAIKNKLLRNWFNALREDYGDTFIDRVQVYLKTVKVLVKAEFPLHYFYRTSEIIEEARALGAGIVVPHPEQFWPILLADYDVDGYEVWNPQSQRYTEFLITAVERKNACAPHDRRLLVFMGDDTHLGEKIKDPEMQDGEKASREVGYQPAWDDPGIRKRLVLCGLDRSLVIEQYRNRLDG
ncbi:MAG: hypothetical protein EOM25_00410 [Deltaproteobacteria bacterium]|nr:hypothetical protein [Deltaproteobacteria bacterium]